MDFDAVCYNLDGMERHLGEERMSDSQKKTGSRCVVLTPSEGVETVCRILEKLGLQANIEHCPLLAMAELSLLHQLRKNDAAWNSSAEPTLLLLINTHEMDDMDDLLRSVRQYLPDVEVSTIRNGQVQSIEDNSRAVDSLEEPPIIRTEVVDPDELSMLLDGTDLGVDE